MKKKHASCLILAVLAIVGTAGGCKGEKVTPEELMTQVTENVEAKKSADANMTLDFAGNISQEANGTSVSVDMTMGMDADIQTIYGSGEESSSYLKGKVDMSVMGVNISVDMESYAVPEDGKMVSYSGTQGQWTRTETETKDISDELLGMDFAEMVKDGKATVTMADKTEKVGEKDCYVVTMTMTGEAVSEFMDASSQMIDSALGDTDLDFSDTKLDYVIYVDKSEKLPVKMTVDAANLYNTAMQSVDAVSADIHQFDITVEMNGYDTVESITVPDDVKQNAVDSDGTGTSVIGGTDGPTSVYLDDGADKPKTYTQDEDGNYILTDSKGTHEAVIGTPDGYESEYASENAVYFSKSDIALDYGFYDYTTAEDMTEYYTKDSSVQDSEEYTDYAISEVMQTEAGGQKISWFKETYNFMDTPCAECNAWITVEDELQFVCRISVMGFDGPADIDEADIKEAFEHVTIQ